MHSLQSFDLKFAQSLYIVVDLNKETEDMLLNVEHAFKVQKAVSQLVKGEISADDYLELVESAIPNMDEYIDEASDNIESFLDNDLHR
jgi:hypothetical protein